MFDCAYDLSQWPIQWQLYWIEGSLIEPTLCITSKERKWCLCSLNHIDISKSMYLVCWTSTWHIVHWRGWAVNAGFEKYFPQHSRLIALLHFIASSVRYFLQLKLSNTLLSSSVFLSQAQHRQHKLDFVGNVWKMCSLGSLLDMNRTGYVTPVRSSAQNSGDSQSFPAPPDHRYYIVTLEGRKHVWMDTGMVFTHICVGRG